LKWKFALKSGYRVDIVHVNCGRPLPADPFAPWIFQQRESRAIRADKVSMADQKVGVQRLGQSLIRIKSSDLQSA
jgi:hypothetical protein